MGYSLAWIAVRGIPPDAVLDRLHLTPTDDVCAFAESDLSTRTLSSGWALIVATRCDHRIVSERELAALSSDSEVLACSIEEHVMYSSCESWKDGRRQWRVVHDAQKGIDHLAPAGELPEDFTLVREQHETLQEAEGGKDAEVDYFFEIPLVLARSRVSFKHDEASEATDGEFRVLRDAEAKTDKPWWRVW